MRLSYILKPRWEIIRRHDLRLRTNPDPITGRELFTKSLADAKRWQKIRLACFIGIYFSAILTTIGAIIAIFWNVALLENAFGAIGGIASSLALLFIAGVFLAGRVLGHLEVDLYFYSDESRQARPVTLGQTEPEQLESSENQGKTVADQRSRRPKSKGRVYTRTPLSSYRP